jgi:ParB family transcriptional regulator, chromosome partitioning protein
MARNALGRGLSALIREPEAELTPPSPVVVPPQPEITPAISSAGAAAAPARQPTEGLLQADIDLIDPSPYQPRTRFRESALEELANSIRAAGIIQPLVVKKKGNRYQLIAGERRWRAAQRAGFPRVPVILRDVSEETAMEMTLVENLQREDLNPIEQASAFDRLIVDFRLTQEQVAERTGKDRATIANALRLLKLEPAIQALLEEGVMSAGHGRALLAITDPGERLAVAKRAAKGGMTVRQIERLSARRPSGEAESKPSGSLDPNTKAAIDELQQEYGTRVLLHPRTPGRPGQLVFEYYTDADLVRLYDRMMGH